MFYRTSRKDYALLDYNQQWWVKIPMRLCIVMLYVPLIIMVVFSFNDSKRNIVWRGFTTEHYGEFFANSLLQQAFINSLVIAIFATVLAVALGVMAAYALNRLQFRGRMGLDIAINVPLAVPEICVAIGTMILFTNLDLPKSMPFPFNLTTLILAHAAFLLPFATLILRARLHAFDKAWEDAALDMGATQKEVIIDLIIPFLSPALISSALLCFVLSLDDFVVTFFVSGPDTPTFAVTVYSMVRMGVTPEINAASTLLILITALALAVWLWVAQRNSKGIV